MISFSETYHEYTWIEETDFYHHYQNEKLPFLYSCNILKFKRNPTLEEFRLAEKKLMNFQKKMQQDFIHLYAAENEPFSKEVEEYLTKENYTIAAEELLVIDSKDFYFTHQNEEIRVDLVKDNKQLKEYLDFMYQLNLKNGAAYAHKKQDFYVDRFISPKVQQINAYLDGQVVGTANIILSSEYVEIDHFEVAPNFQNKGIGTQIQRFIMALAKDKKVLLVVDKGTKASRMYYHQHYQFSGYQLSAFKRFKSATIINNPQISSSIVSISL
ncbi:MAG: GNAT family N-acetyltransferase [Carnobacterium sp.]|uniref:GNAT family N-acetyltransferase n=1 Tax=Carnobacterium sp. TaxID=48221 RepID=UPI00331542E3